MNILENQYISTTLAVFLVLYGSLAAPRLPEGLIKMFSNPFFRMTVIFMIAYTTSKNHSIALIATVTLVLLMQNNADKQNIIIVDDSEVQENVMINNNSEVQKNIMINNNIISTRSKKKHINLEEDENKDEDQVIQILNKKVSKKIQGVKPNVKNNISTQKNIITGVTSNNLIGSEIVNVIRNDTEASEIVAVEEELRKIPQVPDVQNSGLPEPIDNTKLYNVKQNIDESTPLDEQINVTKELQSDKVFIKSTRGLGNLDNSIKPSECKACDSFKRDNYTINTSSIILPYNKNSLFNFNNI